MSKKIILSSGGTGGHIFPTIGIADYFLNKGYEVKIVTDKRGKKFITENLNLQLFILNTETPFNKEYLKKIYSYLKIFISIFKSLFFLIKEKPNLVLGLGGYASFPLCLATKLLNISLVLYENNTVLGRTNSYLLPFAKKILIANDKIYNFPEKYKKKITIVDHILRKNIFKYSKKNLVKKKDELSILVLGGSQGAEVFGTVIPETIKKFYKLGYKVKIYHQCVEKQIKLLTDFYEKNKIDSNVFKFSDNILKFMSNSDIAISRSGASTTAELIFTKTPFIAVPYPHAVDNHQFYNARYYKERGYCWMIEQRNFNKETLFNLLFEILKDTKKIKSIKENMEKKSTKNVYEKVEDTIREFL